MKTTTQLRYHESEWKMYQHDGSLSKFDSLKVITFNVLFPKNHGDKTKFDISHPDIRYPYQFKMFKGLDADIIGLNEVTLEYYKSLLMEEWVQKHYYVCDSIDKKESTFGNVILSKYPFKSVHLVKITTVSRPCLVVEIPTEEDHSVVIAQCHLKANMMQYSTRSRQMEQIYYCMDQLDKNYTKIIMGDLNFHMEMEDSNIRSDFVDVWKITCPDDPGYTFDGTINKMQHELFPSALLSAQMRLDRILLCSKKFAPTRGELIGNKPIFELRQEDFSPVEYIQSPIKAFAGLFGIDVFVKEKEDYLFPSDHFGIFTEFQRSTL